MAKSLTTYPDRFLFVADGIKYTIKELGNPAPLTLCFRIIYRIPTSNQARMEYIYEKIYPDVTISNGLRFSDWKVDLSDIISTYVRRLYPKENYIYGYATVQLTSIDGVSTDLDSNEHICLFGTSGGMDLSGEQPIDMHPFLLSRGNEYGALHFYRAELKAMGAIYALKPDVYTAITFDTDNSTNSSLIQSQLTYHKITIQNRSELLGILYNNNPRNLPAVLPTAYKITSASAIFIQLTGQSGIDDRMYTIAIMDDPDTDETYLIRWTNSMGAPESLLLTGELQDISEVEKPELYISDQSIRSTERKMLRRMVTTKYNLHTGYLTPARIIALKDMLTSEEVEMQIDGEWIPVSVTADPKHSVHQREPETFELTIEVLEQTRYHKPNRTVRPLPATRAGLLQDNSGNIILDNNSNTIQENG